MQVHVATFSEAEEKEKETYNPTSQMLLARDFLTYHFVFFCK
jgi:hypothetical protein